MTPEDDVSPNQLFLKKKSENTWAFEKKGTTFNPKSAAELSTRKLFNKNATEEEIKHFKLAD